MIREICVRGLDDWVDLAEVLWVVASDDPASREARVRQRAIELIRELLERQLVDIGDVVAGPNGGFRPWGLPTIEAVERIRRRLDGLGRRPYPGEVCWLRNTVAGDRLAQRE